MSLVFLYLWRTDYGVFRFPVLRRLLFVKVQVVSLLTSIEVGEEIIFCHDPAISYLNPNITFDAGNGRAKDEVCPLPYLKKGDILKLWFGQLEGSTVAGDWGSYVEKRENPQEYHCRAHEKTLLPKRPVEAEKYQSDRT